MPDQLGELDAAQLQQMGLKLSPPQLWSADGGLMRAAVNLSGCSASFISAQGLIATNHHCAYSALQAASSVDSDVLHRGLLAATPKDEIEAKGRTVRVLNAVKDVTAKVDKATAAAKSDAERSKAADRAQKQLVKICEEQDSKPRCQVAGFYNGRMYRLFEYMELRDIRLVYAPPSMVGEYGGETDNWMWPRHTGDFALLRAYIGKDGTPADYALDNVPYEPKHFLTIGHEGVQPGDFVAVLGFPGRTNRYFPAPEVQRWLEQVFPARIEIYGEWIETMEKLAAADKEVQIKVAAKIKSLANRHKNARGMVDGITRMKLLERRKQEDEKLVDWARSQGRDTFAGVVEGLQGLSREYRTTFQADFLLDNIGRPSDALAIAIDLVRRSREQEKDDLDRRSKFMDRNAKKLWRSQERRLRNFDAGVDTALLGTLFHRDEELVADQRFIPAATPKPEQLVRRTKLTKPDQVKTLWDNADRAALESDRDPMIVLARSIVDALEQKEAREDEWDGKSLVLGPKYFDMLKQVRGGAIYPDANGTMRFSYASVKGYSPRDGIQATPQTTLAGAVDKHADKEPFDLPDEVLGRAADAKDTYWADPGLGDVPICFLSTADTTGGNSGSPVVNGKGELVGLNFDRVWENIAGDFGYNPARSRNVSVDIRYLLWMLDDVADAGHLLEELGVAKFRDAKSPPSRVATRAKKFELNTARAGVADATDGCNCRVDGPGGRGWWLGVVVAAVRRRRTRREA